MPATTDPLLLVLAAALLAACAAAAIAAWQILGRLRASEKHLARLEDLAALREQLERLAGATPELDLRRLEHVLIDLRDAQKRSEERMLALIESTRAGAAAGQTVAVAAGGALLAERVVTRMLSLGYERVQLVTPMAELEPLLTGEGHVTLEARREGVVCKGRVKVRAGAIQDVQMQSAYSAFP
ncbi:MAG: hypothetical protein IPJ19_14160 [Planctomycetes bacterium]|nr:hypothetical protein [Planctomycetota bacterium]